MVLGGESGLANGPPITIVEQELPFEPLNLHQALLEVAGLLPLGRLTLVNKPKRILRFSFVDAAAQWHTSHVGCVTQCFEGRREDEPRDLR